MVEALSHHHGDISRGVGKINKLQSINCEESRG